MAGKSWSLKCKFSNKVPKNRIISISQIYYCLTCYASIIWYYNFWDFINDKLIIYKQKVYAFKEYCMNKILLKYS
jgi:hypothetical protein